MNYLTQQTGSNIQENGTIEITTNSSNDKSYLKNIVEYKNDDQFFFYNNNTKMFACFYFKEKSIQLSEYSIKTYGNGKNGHHLKNWCIEVSNDGSNWKEIDHRPEDQTLNGPHKQSIFKINEKQTEFYHFIRLLQTGCSWYGNYDFDISKIEFFGILKCKN